MLIDFAFLDASNPTRVLMQTFEEGIRGVVLFLVAMFFLKKSSKILLNKQRWSKITNIFVLVILLIFVVIEFICGFTVYVQDRTDYDACTGSVDLSL